MFNVILADERCIIVKFLMKKVRKQDLNVKKDIQKITTTDLDLSGSNIKLYVNESLCSYYFMIKE